MNGTVTNIFYDAEFYQPRGTFACIPISYGMVNEAGSDHFYGVNGAMPEELINDFSWLKKHVMTKLPARYGSAWQSLPEIKAGIIDFFARNKAADVQIWPRNGAYDITVLCMLFGNMSALFDETKKLGIKNLHFRDVNEIRRALGKVDATPINEAWAHASICDSDHDRYVFHRYKQLYPEKLAEIVAPRIDFT